MIRVKNLKIHSEDDLSLRLDIPSLEFEKNKVNILLGPNGGGKSTLLDCLSLNLPLDGLGREGQIFIEDRELSKYSYHDLSLKMSYIPQQLDWNHSFKVEDILNFSVFPRSQKNELTNIDRKHLDEICELLEIQKFRNRLFSHLSGGEQKRVSIACSLFQGTDYILIDEPFAALDPIYKKKVAKVVIDWQKKYQTTFILCVHELNLASLMGDRFLSLKEGQLVKESSRLTKEDLSSLFDTPFEIFSKGEDQIFFAYSKGDLHE